MHSLNFLDWMAFAVILFSVVTAFIKGLSVELFSLASVLTGFFLAVFFYADGARFFAAMGMSAALANFLGFTSIFLIVVVVGSVLILLLDRALRKLHVKWMDRLLGALFGLARGWLIAVVIFLAFTAFPVRRDWLQNSQSAEFFLTSAQLAVALTPEEFKAKFQAGYQSLYRFWIQQKDQGL